MFFDNTYSIVRILTVGTFSYMALIAVLRLTGKRTLTRLNAFDMVVTVALGSTLASAITSADIALIEGVVSLTLLVVLQYVVTCLSLRIKGFGHLVKAEPKMLFYRGTFQETAPLRVRKDEILQAVRSRGLASLNDVEAVVLETNGRISVITTAKTGGISTLENVKGYTNAV
jgi:uncharacterized membrane protein YcaP (DUF421 family)